MTHIDVINRLLDLEHWADADGVTPELAAAILDLGREVLTEVATTDWHVTADGFHCGMRFGNFQSDDLVIEASENSFTECIAALAQQEDEE
jgi:hypothetical protein